eukprot:SAG31_NODE_2523_length_5562_cov_4.427238_3_plen_62_part_00
MRPERVFSARARISSIRRILLRCSRARGGASSRAAYICSCILCIDQRIAVSLAMRVKFKFS